MKAILASLSLSLAALSACHADLVIEAETASVKTEGGSIGGGIWNLYSSGRVGENLEIATAGEYEIVVRAYGEAAGGVWPRVAILVDGRRRAEQTVGGDKPMDYRFAVKLEAGACEVAAAFLNDAVIDDEDRNLYLDRITIIPPEGAAAPKITSRAAVWAMGEEREAAVLAATAESIGRNRKREAILVVTDSTGKPLSGTPVTMELVRHEFLFGCNLFEFDRYATDDENRIYKRRFEELFNAATLPFYWRSYEWRKGEPDYPKTDKLIAWCRERGIRMKGHPLLWGHKAGVPPWSNGLPSSESQRQRVEEILRRYQGKIEFWEVVNEPSHIVEPKIDAPYRWARAVDPTAHLIVNDYQAMADGRPSFFRLLTAAKQSGVPYDGIGIQAHEPRTMRFPLDQVQRVLDQYAELGKDLHITEFTPTTNGASVSGWRAGATWTEELQADYAEKFYRVCFAHPRVVAITWWDLCESGSWLEGGGLLRKDFTPKPAYHRLRKLIHDEWSTKVVAKTDADGIVAFTGFRGEYRITVKDAGSSGTFFRSLKSGGKNRWEVSVTTGAERPQE
jgi:endo-1,4-beta-xylanase